MRLWLGATWAMMLGSASALAIPPSPPTDLQIVSHTAQGALLRWTPGAGQTKAFKIRKSLIPGVHPSPTTFPGGKLAAFTWTTDDGFEDNLIYEPIFSSRGLEFSIFVNPSTIGDANKLTWGEVQALHLSGHEIANHTQTHTTLINDRAIAVRYTGAEPCSLAIASSHLRTWVDGALDLDILLTNPAVAYLSTLAAFLDAEPSYDATLLFAPDTIYATRSQWLDPVSGFEIGAGADAETLTTMRGVHDDAELAAEILDAQNELEDRLQLIDPTYECRTLAYPNHGHTQWAMSKLNALGYLGARSGPIGSLPFYSTAAFEIGYTSTYEVPHSYPRPSNAWSETLTRSTVAARVAEWKADREWAVLMAHHEGEVDAQHLEWTIDTIAADPEVWIARFDEVLLYLDQFATDVGYPINAAGQTQAWVHGLSPGNDTYVVITAYNSDLQESAWSEEITIPSLPGTDAPPARGSVIESLVPRAYPNPFEANTRIEFVTKNAGKAEAVLWDLSGRRVRQIDLGQIAAGPSRFDWDGRDDEGAKAGAGVYWVRVDVDGKFSPAGKVTLLY